MSNLEIVEKYASEGKVCIIGIEDTPMVVDVKEFIKQPLEGLLYDLNRLPEVIKTFAETDQKWINDYAVYMTIKELYKEVEQLKARIVVLEKLLIPLARLDLTGVKGNIVYARNKTEITVDHVKNALAELPQPPVKE
jgi:hypothetical protein